MSALTSPQETPRAFRSLSEITFSSMAFGRLSMKGMIWWTLYFLILIIVVHYALLTILDFSTMRRTSLDDSKHVHAMYTPGTVPWMQIVKGTR